VHYLSAGVTPGNPCQSSFPEESFPQQPPCPDNSTVFLCQGKEKEGLFSKHDLQQKCGSISAKYKIWPRNLPFIYYEK